MFPFLPIIEKKGLTLCCIVEMLINILGKKLSIPHVQRLHMWDRQITVAVMTNLGCTKYAIRCVYQLVKEAHCAFFYSYVHGRVSYRHYIEVTQGGIFISYGTEYEIWSVCGPVGHTEYRGTDYEQLHHVFRGKKVISIFLKKYCSIRTKKLHKYVF